MMALRLSASSPPLRAAAAVKITLVRDTRSVCLGERAATRARTRDSSRAASLVRLAQVQARTARLAGAQAALGGPDPLWSLSLGNRRVQVEMSSPTR